ncbi:MAG TPA: cache domain-containing protein [Azospirillaceae bacterium]|nr:cache domain-containing protein [Azospirillaceae bacterium]
MIKTVGALIVCLMMATSAHAQTTKPTQEDAKRITEQAADLIAAKGIEEAGKIFNQDGDFKYGEIYVNVINTKGNWVVYPPKPALVGNSVLAFADPDGKKLGQAILDTGLQGEGWVEYRWKNPASDKIEPKITYVKKVPGQDFITYVGIYK